MTLSRTQITIAGVGAGLLAVIALAVANFAGDGENGGAPEYAATLGGSLVVAAALFGWIIPRARRPGRAGLVAGLLGALSLAVFWTGLPFVLGPAAAALGLRGRSPGSRLSDATAAVVLGAAVTLAGIAGVVLDGTA